MWFKLSYDIIAVIGARNAVLHTVNLKEARLCHAGQGEHRLRNGPCQAQSVPVCDAPYPDKA